MSQFDTAALYEFLAHTPEQGLRKLLVDQKPMAEAHLSLLLKVVRSGTSQDFAAHFEKQDFPKVKLSPSEQKIKEKFWADCLSTLKARGLLSPLQTPQAS